MFFVYCVSPSHNFSLPLCRVIWSPVYCICVVFDLTIIFSSLNRFDTLLCGGMVKSLFLLPPLKGPLCCLSRRSTTRKQEVWQVPYSSLFLQLLSSTTLTFDLGTHMRCIFTPWSACLFSPLLCVAVWRRSTRPTLRFFWHRRVITTTTTPNVCKPTTNLWCVHKHLRSSDEIDCPTQIDPLDTPSGNTR